VKVPSDREYNSQYLLAELAFFHHDAISVSVGPSEAYLDVKYLTEDKQMVL
jgi:hypothetical protein